MLEAPEGLKGTLNNIFSYLGGPKQSQKILWFQNAFISNTPFLPLKHPGFYTQQENHLQQFLVSTATIYQLKNVITGPWIRFNLAMNLLRHRNSGWSMNVSLKVSILTTEFWKQHWETRPRCNNRMVIVFVSQLVMSQWSQLCFYAECTPT